VLITVVPAESKVMRPPRAVVPLGHKLGRVMGNAGQSELQMRVLKYALGQLEELHAPGELVEFTP